MSNQGMICSRQGSFNFVYCLIDISIIISILVVATFAYNVTFTSLYTSTALAGAVMFMLCAETFGLYRSWRASTVIRMMLITSITWWLCAMFVVLLGFFIKVSIDFHGLLLVDELLLLGLV
jgi:putative colanic acid biosynthesis UDP-glucose lipid carrier transferase